VEEVVFVSMVDEEVDAKNAEEVVFMGWNGRGRTRRVCGAGCGWGAEYIMFGL